MAREDKRKRPAAASVRTTAMTQDGQPMDYWFDLSLDTTSGSKRCIAYGYGMQLDDRTSDNDAGRSAGEVFTELMTDCLPAIKADIDAYGIA